MAKNGNNDRNNGKPQKRDFYKLVVLGPNGSTVDQREWSKQVDPNLGEKDLRNQLKKAGFTPVRHFLQQEYDTARDEYKTQSRGRNQNNRKALIAQAFQDADVQPHSQVERALSILIPLLDDGNDKRVTNTLRNIVRSVDGVMSDEGRSKNKTSRGGRDSGQRDGGQSRRSADRDQGGDSSGTNGKRSADKEDRDQGGQGRGQQVSGDHGGTEEQLEMIANIKEEYDQAVEQAMADQDMEKLTEVKKLYDDAVERVMAGEQVDSMFDNQDGRGQGGQQASDGRGRARDPENDNRRKPGGNNPEGINNSEGTSEGSEAGLQALDENRVTGSANDGRGIAKDPKDDDRRKPGGNNPEGINNSDGTSEGSQNGMRALDENRSEGGRRGGGDNGGQNRGASGEGGEAPNGQKLTKSGEPDQRTKGDDQEEAPGQQTRREHGNQGRSSRN